MKKPILPAILFSITLLFTSSALATDACETVLCLYGKMTGNSGGNECRSAERAFFTIVKKNRHGFQPNKTADARNAFLRECKSADPAIISQIINKYGRIHG